MHPKPRPNSDKNFSFRVVTPSLTARLDPGSKDAYDKWQDSLAQLHKWQEVAA